MTGTITALFTHAPDPTEPTEYRLTNRSGRRVVAVGDPEPSESGHNIITIRFPDGLVAEAFEDELTEWRLSA